MIRKAMRVLVPAGMTLLIAGRRTVREISTQPAEAARRGSRDVLRICGGGEDWLRTQSQKRPAAGCIVCGSMGSAGI